MYNHIKKQHIANEKEKQVKEEPTRINVANLEYVRILQSAQEKPSTLKVLLATLPLLGGGGEKV